VNERKKKERWSDHILLLKVRSAFRGFFADVAKLF